MHKQAMALGYYFLAVFCVLTSTFLGHELSLLLLVAAVAAAIAGFGFQFDIPLTRRKLADLIQLAQEPPVRETKLSDEHPV